ncbi:dual specificity mitogen-activated protein kinase kinase 5-like isoform X2 [Sycon ciliatum]
MTAAYFWECQRQGEYSLQIYPHYPRQLFSTTERRNPLGLTVNPAAPPRPTPVVREVRPPPRSERSNAVDIMEILQSAPIEPSDIQYLEILGHGNGGTVYRAHHRRIPPPFNMAVKLIPVDVTEEVQQQIMSELAILHQCKSEYVIHFFGAFFTENRISICTEYMDGGSLDRYVPIPENVLGRVAVQVVKGMVYLWHQGNGPIMHRDIKPSNILVNLNGAVKLCDFGVSVQLVNSIARTFVGTNAYMAPERIQGEPYSINSEIWSLGISIVEMAIGRFPYPANSAEQPPVLAIELLQMVVYEDPPALPVPEFSMLFSDFCSQCMRKRPEQRIGLGELLNHPFMQNMSDSNTEIIALFVRDHQEYGGAAMAQRYLLQQQQEHRQQQQQMEMGGAAAAAAAAPYGGLPPMYSPQQRREQGSATPVIAMATTDTDDDALDSAGTVTTDNSLALGDAINQAHPLPEEQAMT